MPIKSLLFSHYKLIQIDMEYAILVSERFQSLPPDHVPVSLGSWITHDNVDMFLIVILEWMQTVQIP